MKVSYLFVFCLSFLCTALCADTITLSDGTLIQGTIQQISDQKMTVKTKHIGTLTIPQKSIVRIDSQQDLAIKLQNGEKSQGTLNSSQAGQVTITDPHNPELQTPIQRIETLWPAQATDPDILAQQAKWKTTLGFDLRGKTGNSDKVALSSNIDSQRSTPQTLLALYAGIYQTKTNSKQTEERILGGVRWESYFSMENLGWYLREELEQDKVKNLDFRSITATGLTYRILNKKKHKFTVRSGLGYQYETYPDSDSESSITGDLGLNYQQDYKNQFIITSDLSIIPNFSHPDDYQIYHDTGINIPFPGQSWQLRLGVSNTYDNEPEPGKRELDTTYYTRLQFKWE